MKRTLWTVPSIAVLLVAMSIAALAEVTVLRGSPLNIPNPAPQSGSTADTDNAVNAPAREALGPADQSGPVNARRTGSANAGGEIANPPVGFTSPVR